MEKKVFEIPKRAILDSKPIIVDSKYTVFIRCKDKKGKRSDILFLQKSNRILPDIQFVEDISRALWTTDRNLLLEFMGTVCAKDNLITECGLLKRTTSFDIEVLVRA